MLILQSIKSNRKHYSKQFSAITFYVYVHPYNLFSLSSTEMLVNLFYKMTREHMNAKRIMAFGVYHNQLSLFKRELPLLFSVFSFLLALKHSILNA